MSKAEKLFDKLIVGLFQRGSSFINLQPTAAGKAKAYQVRQVRCKN
jgi:hypothetical protein